MKPDDIEILCAILMACQALSTLFLLFCVFELSTVKSVLCDIREKLRK